MRRARPAVVVLAVLGVLLAGCTGVPSDSAPMVIKTVPIGGEDGQAPATTPAPGIGPNTLVSDFLQANALDASEQTSPRGFLSSAARNSWSDTTVTVIDSPTVRFYSARHHSVTVTGRVLGTVDATGVYTPTLLGADSEEAQFVYGVRLVGGQYRITSLRNGLLLSEADFTSYYTPRPVYYYDLAHRYLVPDPRWTSLTDPTQLADFLMNGLTRSSPSDEISNSVSNDTLPARAAASGRINVTVGSTTKIEIPGSSQLGATNRNRLAEQVSATLAGVPRTERLELTDGGKPVTIPAVHGTIFVAADFSARTEPPQPPPDVYFLRSGKVYGQEALGQNAVRLKGAVNGSYFLQSVAVAQDKQQGTNAVAGTAGRSSSQLRLLVGTQSGGLRQTTVRGPLTRPAFAPGRSEVWVGDGDRLYLVEVDNEKKTQHVERIGLPSAAGDGRIVALRLSPDGSRIALVIRGANGAQQLFVAAVVRAGGQVTLGQQLQQVSPDGVLIQDVAWAEPLKLVAIGYNPHTLEHHVYDVGSDGSSFTTQSTGNLPGVPSFLAVAVRQPIWVTANRGVWQQEAGNTWVSPGAGLQTDGYAPVYLE
ncbi:LpqB family beta-propeller domain-containing protein [Jatrophihabitans endophyticus]|uniref:LpqB family beta-propeller domain-containing protein n=1 Tax=Jatrophihabitans endophyticus TaxID=1206085 RepID=UPI0019FA2F5F|nr:LpqB family beta-propeller domain-containing protein [Jatrophihabitans endophyticus]MBE7188812.1 hypothetical protein [Jatrophihabitans endophyticus]